MLFVVARSKRERQKDQPLVFINHGLGLMSPPSKNKGLVPSFFAAFRSFSCVCVCVYRYLLFSIMCVCVYRYLLFSMVFLESLEAGSHIIIIFCNLGLTKENVSRGLWLGWFRSTKSSVSLVTTQRTFP